MRAIVIEKFGGLDSLVYKDIPETDATAWTCLFRNLEAA